MLLTLRLRSGTIRFMMWILRLLRLRSDHKIYDVDSLGIFRLRSLRLRSGTIRFMMWIILEYFGSAPFDFAQGP